MDLIYTDPSRVDQGVLEAYAFDLSYGAEENDFEVTLGANEPMIEPGSVVYIEGTEYGGQIDGMKVKTDGETVTYKGRTWHGILNSKVIEPLAESEYMALAEGYHMLDYIEATGTQWIDTGIVPTVNTRVEIKSWYNHGSDQAICGVRSSIWSDAFILWDASLGGFPLAVGTIGNVSTGNVDLSAYGDTGTIREIAWGNGKLYLGDTLLKSATPPSTYTCSHNLYIFALHMGNGTVDGRKYVGKLYYFRVYESDVLVRDMIPCAKDNGKVGLYDRVEGKFYGSSGTGEFLPGNYFSPELAKPVADMFPFPNGHDPGTSMLDGSVTLDADACEYTVSGTLNRAGNINLTPPSGVSMVAFDFEAGKTYTLALRHVSGDIAFSSPTGSTAAAFAIFDSSMSKFQRYIIPRTYTSGDIVVNFRAEDFSTGVAKYAVLFQCWDVGMVFNDFKFYVQLFEGTHAVGGLPEYIPKGQSSGGIAIETEDSNGGSLLNKYFIISGDAHDCVRYLLKRHGLSELFAVPEEKSGVNISEHKFHRYCKGYDGLRDMLEDNGAKLKIEWKDRSVLLYAEPIADYTESPIDGDIASLTVEQHKNKVNHLICLGKGELEAREIIHLYVDQNGSIGDTKCYTGMDEYTDVYENTNAESSEDLRNGGVSRLKELRNNDKAEIALPETEGLSYDIGDIVGASEIRSGVKVAAAVTQKIVKINNGVVSADYKTGG